MHLQIIRGLILFLAASSPAWATPVIDVGTHYLLPDTQRTIPITVSGGDQVEGLNFYVQVADGGAINGGTATKPKITGIDIIGPGTLFSQSNRGSQPTHLPTSGGTYLIWKDWTVTQRDDEGNSVKLNATGTLAYVTIDTTGTHSSDPSYALNLAGVAAGYPSPNPGYDTDFNDILPTINAGAIVIVDLHPSKWNAGLDGNWTNATWTNPQPPFPNYTTQAIVDTPHTVNVASAQEANSLALSGLGNVAIGSAGSLTLTTDATIAYGSNLHVEGILDAQNITLNGTLNMTSGGSARVANISGTGDLDVVGGSSNLTAASIQVDTLTIGAGSQAGVNSLAGIPPSGGASLTSVPEPSTITLLGMIAIGLSAYAWRQTRINKPLRNSLLRKGLQCRGDKIRTCDLLNPILILGFLSLIISD